ncbi:IS1182 family transposase [Olivibacter sp. XZL3]|uniref:IS1182 family transposase n=1 Tax=Olivibacter sp. XZL3 TaxID=1735116 RepID=UPI001065CE4F|nr:IS1182 family transposase [Olivibacter sp. XZL3]
MQGKKTYQEKLFIQFQLSDYVPADNFYRRLKETLDFEFLYATTSKYYGSEGQKSIDPVVFMKLMLVGYLENLNSDRRIICTSKLRLDILYILDYDLDEELPWHSTLSRTRQLYGQEVFSELFRRVLGQCIEKGMVSGRRQAVDGVYVKANASLDSMVRKDILEDAERYARELEENEEVHAPRSVEMKKTKDRHYPLLRPKKNAHNDTHISPSDPDAKMAVKTGKAMALNYLGQVSVDTASHVITHIQAFTADKNDSQCLPILLPQLVRNLQEHGLDPEELVADTGYSSGEALKALQENNIRGYIPNRPHFMYEREGFSYNRQGDFYTCGNGKQLKYVGTFKNQRSFNREYRIGVGECRECPVKEMCPAYRKNKGTSIKSTIDKDYYDQMHLRMQTKKAKILMRKRQSTVEPVIGTLVNYLGMKKVNTKGLAQANKCMTIAAIAYNLKKMLKFSPKNWISNLQRIKLAGKRLSQLIFNPSSMSLIRPGLDTLPTY